MLVPALLLLITAVSWAKGKLAKAGDPPLSKAQPVAFQNCVPARFQYTVLGASKVMPVLPPASPRAVPDRGVAAPVMVMSVKSTLARPLTAATDTVRAVANTLLATDKRRMMVVLAVVQVPPMVWFPRSDSPYRPLVLVFTVVVTLLKVLLPEIVNAVVLAALLG